MSIDTKSADTPGGDSQDVLLGTHNASLFWAIIFLLAAGGVIYSGFQINISGDFWWGLVFLGGSLVWLALAWSALITKKIIAHPDHQKLMVEQTILGNDFSVKEYSYDDFTSTRIVHNITIAHNHSGVVDSDDYAHRGIGNFDVELILEKAGKISIDKFDYKNEAESKAVEVEKVLGLDRNHREYTVNIHRKSPPSQQRPSDDED